MTTESSSLGSHRSWVGASVKRREDARLLRGRGQYLDDLRMAGLAHVAFLRSSHAHARIRKVDVSAARQLPGVLAALTASDLADLPPLRPASAAEVANPGRPLLAEAVVRFVGEPVAVVVAESRYVAEDACGLIQVDYEPLPAVVDPERVEQAPVALHPQVPDNVYFRYQFEAGDVDAAFAQAEVVVERRFRSPRHAAAPLETRGTVATYDSRRGELRLWSSTQVPHTLQQAVAEHLSLPVERVRISTPDVGGGFGLKAVIAPEDLVVAWLSRRLERPVKWVEDRQEHLQASVHTRDQVLTLRAAATRAGEVLALEARVRCDHGAYPAYPYGATLEATVTPRMIPGPYRVRNYRYTTEAVATNKCPEGPYRGVGQAVASFVHERMIDLVAGAAGLDPAEVRRRNLLRDDEFPYTSVTNMAYESGRYGACLELALDRLDYGRLRAEQEALRHQGRFLGLGLGCYVEFTGIGSGTFKGRGTTTIPGFDAARIALRPSGQVLVWTSLPTLGQGVETTFAQLAADGLGVDVAAVAVQPTDTAEAPFGSGTFASRSAIAGGGAIHLACAALKERTKAVAARELEVSVQDLELEGGLAAVRGAPERRLTYAQVAAAAERAGERLEASERYDPPTATFANAAHAAAVEVDVETGLVRVRRYVVAEDSGPLINPTIVDGQVHGAVAQGLGGALLEEVYYGQDGQVASATLMDYLLPNALEVPAIEVLHQETPTPLVPGGFKGVGEGGLIGALPALANAVADALAPFGVEVNELPASPERIRGWLRGRPNPPTPFPAREGGDGPNPPLPSLAGKGETERDRSVPPPLAGEGSGERSGGLQ